MRSSFNPKWKGRFLARSGPIRIYSGLLLHWGKEKGSKFISEISQSSTARMVSGHTQQANLIGAGEIQNGALALWLQTAAN